MVDRGLDVSGGILVIIVGGEGLRKAVGRSSEVAQVQPCRIHKERNVIRHLPDYMHTQVRRKLRRA